MDGIIVMGAVQFGSFYFLHTSMNVYIYIHLCLFLQFYIYLRAHGPILIILCCANIWPVAILLPYVKLFNLILELNNKRKKKNFFSNFPYRWSIKDQFDCSISSNGRRSIKSLMFIAGRSNSIKLEEELLLSSSKPRSARFVAYIRANGYYGSYGWSDRGSGGSLGRGGNLFARLCRQTPAARCHQNHQGPIRWSWSPNFAGTKFTEHRAPRLRGPPT